MEKRWRGFGGFSLELSCLFERFPLKGSRFQLQSEDVEWELNQNWVWLYVCEQSGEYKNTCEVIEGPVCVRVCPPSRDPLGIPAGTFGHLIVVYQSSRLCREVFQLKTFPGKRKKGSDTSFPTITLTVKLTANIRQNKKCVNLVLCVTFYFRKSFPTSHSSDLLTVPNLIWILSHNGIWMLKALTLGRSSTLYFDAVCCWFTDGTNSILSKKVSIFLLWSRLFKWEMNPNCWKGENSSNAHESARSLT